MEVKTDLSKTATTENNNNDKEEVMEVKIERSKVMVPHQLEFKVWR